jgi:hypothetical protein
MLKKEAEKAGIVVTEEEIEQQLRMLEQQGITPRYLTTIRQRHNLSMTDIRRAFGALIAISRNAERLTRAAVPSEPEIRHYVQATEDRVQVKCVMLDAARFIDKRENVSEEEVLSQFERYRDVDPAKEGIGYRNPDRVKVEYIVASMRAIKPHVEVSFEDVKAYWKVKRSEFKKVEFVDEPVTTTAPASTQPTTKPAKKRVEREKTFSEARDEIEALLIEQRTAKLAQQAIRKATNELLKPWHIETTDPKTGFKSIPSEVRAPGYMQSIREKVEREVGVSLDYGETPLVSRKQLAEIRALKGATTAGTGQDRLSIEDYAFRVPAFLDQDERRAGRSTLQLFQPPDAPLYAEDRPSWQLVDGRMNEVPGSVRLIIFRVVEAREAAAPADVAEVRQAVEHDIRLARAFERAKPLAEEFCSVARRLGLDEAWDVFAEEFRERGVRRPILLPAFAHRISLGQERVGDFEEYLDALLAGESTLVPPAIRDVKDRATFVDACFAMVDQGWTPEPLSVQESERIQAATTRPAAQPEPSVCLLPLATEGKWVTIELVKSEPVDEDQFESELRTATARQLMMERRTALRVGWFKPKNIEKRCGYRPTADEVPPDSDEETQQGDEPEPEDS